MTTKLLFISKSSIPNLKEAVLFLTKILKRSDVVDQKNIRWVMRYLIGYQETPLTLEDDNTQVVEWWVDSSLDMHSDIKIHTGATISLGKLSIYYTSVRQKLNMRIYTEAKTGGSR